MAVLGYFSKIKKESGASFWCTLSAWFFRKNVPYLILYQWTKFHCHTFFLSQDIKQNMLFSSYLDSWWPHKLFFIKIFLGSTSEAMADLEKKRGEDENTKNWISWKRSFLDELKNIFQSFWRAIIWWKIKIW